MGQEFLYLPGFLRIPVPAKRCHAPTSKLTTLQTPKHAPKHVVYSMQYHLLLQLNLNTKIVRCCCRHLRHSIFVPSPVLPHFLLDIITTVFAWRWRDPPPPVYLQFALAGCRVASCGSTSTSTSRLYDALPASRVLLQQNICLSSYRGAAGFRDAIASCLLPPPRLPLVPWLVVVMPLVTSLPPPLVLSKKPLAFETPSPPVCPSFADWLSR